MEQEIIKKIVSILPRSDLHCNDFFESDAEIISYNGKKLLLSVDEFSQEDFFSDEDGYSLGWNLATCTLSDILASGGKPLLYSHSMSIPIHTWDSVYIDSFSNGIASVLKQCSAGFIGGDLGNAEKWHYTGVAIGETEKPLTRKGAEAGHIIYMTGTVGAGNLQAYLKTGADKKRFKPLIDNYKMQLPLRVNESRLINQYATSCIDSSDGLLNALNTIAEINNTGYIIENVPYSKEGIMACKLLHLPVAGLLLGECGEYELVFTIKKEQEEKFCETASKSGFALSRIGEIVEKDRKVIHTPYGVKNLGDFNLKARNYNELDVYLNDLILYTKSINGD